MSAASWILWILGYSDAPRKVALGTHFPRRFPSLSPGSKWCLDGGMQFWAEHRWMIGHLWPSFFSLMGTLGW